MQADTRQALFSWTIRFTVAVRKVFFPLSGHGNLCHDEAVLQLGPVSPVINEPLDSFRQRVFYVIDAIPYGKLTTYGEVAHLAGSPRAARQVGGILSRLPSGSRLPWHRVVNRHGAISLAGEGFYRQRAALEAEGVVVNDDGKIDLAAYHWQR